MLTLQQAESLLTNRNKSEFDFQTHHLLCEIEENRSEERRVGKEC
jgi:hypothetical protein